VELQRADSLTTNNAARALMQRCHLGVCKKAIDGCCTFILCETAGRTVGAYCMVGLQDVMCSSEGTTQNLIILQRI
jgi:hypothetical protein